MADRTTGKAARMHKVEQFLLAQREPVSQAEIARHCGVNRSTINRMLADLGETGVPLHQAPDGKIEIIREGYLTSPPCRRPVLFQTHDPERGYMNRSCPE